jgi:HEAT repeat protein
LARLGTSADLGLAFELGQPSEGSELPGLELRAALEGALVSILAREPGAGRILSDLFARVGPAARSVIVHALASARGGPTSALADLLGRAGGGSDAVVLLALGRTARRALPEPDLQVAERVRGYFTHPDPRLVVLAAAASAALADDAAVPDLIVLLEDEDANARTAALSALRELSAAPLEGESKAWLAWLDEGLAWWNDRADSCRVALVSGTPLEAAQALHEVARQRLYVRELVPLLQLAARRPEPDLARSACRALASLPPRLARASLLALVRMSEPGVAEAARASLARLRSAPKRAPRPILTLPQLEPIP